MLTKPRTDRGHGSPFDRGGADYWYGRQRNPHMYPLGTACRVTDLAPEELAEYHAGYDRAEADGGQKEWD